MRNLLSEIRGIADSALPIDEAGDGMALALRRVDNWSPVVVGDVVESKRDTMAYKNVPDGDAEGGPRKLDQCKRGTYMKEAKRNETASADARASSCGC